MDDVGDVLGAGKLEGRDGASIRAMTHGYINEGDTAENSCDFALTIPVPPSLAVSVDL